MELNDTKRISDEIERGAEIVRELSKPGRALDSNGPSATASNPNWWRRDGKPTESREELHDRILDKARSEAPGVKREKKAIILAGPPGAGKSHLIADILGDKAGDYMVTDADKFKRELLIAAEVDGSFETHLKPEEMRRLEQEGVQFYRMDYASLVHEESSHLAKKQRLDAIEAGYNIVIDSVLGSKESAAEQVELLTAAGYEITVIDLEVPEDFSQQKARDRWLKGRREAAQGQNPDGGRYVPEEYIKGLYGADGKSKCETVARELFEEYSSITNYELHRKSMSQVNEAKAIPTLEVRLQRAKPGAPIVDAKANQKSKRSVPGPAPGPAVVKVGPRAASFPTRAKRGGAPSRSNPDMGRS